MMRRDEVEIGIKQYVELTKKWLLDAKQALIEKTGGEYMLTANDFETIGRAQQRAHLMAMIDGGDGTDLLERANQMIRESTKALMNGWYESRYTGDYSNAEQCDKRDAARWLIDSLSFVSDYVAATKEI